ncbi:MAG: cobalamin-dependent protein [Thermodesulfovibrionales bacterium]
MKLELIFPEWGHFPLIYRRHMPVLGLSTIAALTPNDWDISSTDERIEPLFIKKDVDLVGISLMTPQANRAYQIADEYRALGIPVVLGGVHVSLAPHDALNHADAIVIGEAEGIWEKVIEDFTNDGMKKIYKCETPPLEVPFPRWDVICKGKDYMPINSIQVARGCPVNCDMCSVPQTFGSEFRMRDIDTLIAEIEKLERYVFIVNDNLHLAKRRTTPFLKALEDTRKEWVGMAPLKIAEDMDFLGLIKNSNCWAMYIDLSPWISAGLNDFVDGVQVNKAGDYIKRIHDAGIKIIASFVFGYDHDNKDIFDKTVEFSKKHEIEEVEFHILTPYPNTRLYERLNSQGRLITSDFSEYTTAKVVFKPVCMSPDELYEGYLDAWRSFYSEDYEDTDKGPVVRTFACFPLKPGDVLKYTDGAWVRSVLKEKGATT